MRADIHDGPEHMLQSETGYIDARPLNASSTKPLATHGRTIHVGQTRSSGYFRCMSAQAPQAEIQAPAGDVRLVPIVLQKSPKRRAHRKVGPFRDPAIYA